jgi:hypothetical protein
MRMYPYNAECACICAASELPKNVGEAGTPMRPTLSWKRCSDRGCQAAIGTAVT